jgi:hypothetical protein
MRIFLTGRVSVVAILFVRLIFLLYYPCLSATGEEKNCVHMYRLQSNHRPVKKVHKLTFEESTSFQNFPCHAAKKD